MSVSRSSLYPHAAGAGSRRIPVEAIAEVCGLSDEQAQDIFGDNVSVPQSRVLELIAQERLQIRPNYSKHPFFRLGKFDEAAIARNLEDGTPLPQGVAERRDADRSSVERLFIKAGCRSRCPAADFINLSYGHCVDRYKIGAWARMMQCTTR
ncbi:MAG: hypothetical protein WDN72_02160 [Alphaproteobacteria bacterium]